MHDYISDLASQVTTVHLLDETGRQGPRAGGGGLDIDASGRIGLGESREEDFFWSGPLKLK